MSVKNAIIWGCVAQGGFTLAMLNHRGKTASVPEIAAYSAIGGIGAGLGAYMAEVLAPGNTMAAVIGGAVFMVAYDHFLLM